MSARCIFFVQDLRDACAGQLHTSGLIGPNQRNLDPSLFDNRRALGRRWIRDGHGGTLWQSRFAVQDHHAIVYSTGNDHAVIICRTGHEIKSKPASENLFPTKQVVYDCIYLAFAESEGCEMVSAYDQGKKGRRGPFLGKERGTRTVPWERKGDADRSLITKRSASPFLLFGSLA